MTDYNREEMELVHDAGTGVEVRKTGQYKLVLWDGDVVLRGPVSVPSVHEKDRLVAYANGYSAAKKAWISKMAEKLVELTDDDMTPDEIMEKYFN